MQESKQTWDEYLFKGTATYYERGRLPYADGLASTLSEKLNLRGHGTVADIGCGPGTLARLMAGLCDRVVAVDPDADMIEHGRALAESAGISNITWLTLPAEEIAFEVGELDAAVFGQSFHWMDRSRVAAQLRTSLRAGGHLVLVSDVKNAPKKSASASADIPHQEINGLIREYLGDVRRAGRSLLTSGTPADEETVLAEAGFIGPDRFVVEAPGTLRRAVGDIIAEIYSKSSSAPHLFGDQLSEFDERLRVLLERHAHDGFYEADRPDTDVRIWASPSS
ncbi:class I SAM-dependent methyltransferase [Streptomyces sp. CL12]|uniref:class I SAM-dependent methyltransferase n=1 Tax=Streptomyces sp. CL12 TaxID=3391744 RepID=UPI003A803305